MPERQLVHQSERRTTQDRNLAAGLQPAASAQFVGLLAARRVCTDTSGDERMRKTSTWLLEQGTQTRLLRNGPEIRKQGPCCEFRSIAFRVLRVKSSEVKTDMRKGFRLQPARRS